MNKRQMNEIVKVALIGNLMGMGIGIGFNVNKDSIPDELHQCQRCGYEYMNYGPKYCPECMKRLWKKDGEE